MSAFWLYNVEEIVKTNICFPRNSFSEFIVEEKMCNDIGGGGFS